MKKVARLGLGLGRLPPFPPDTTWVAEGEENDGLAKRLEGRPGGGLRPPVDSGGAGYKRDAESGEVAGVASRQTNGPSTDRRQS